MAQEGNVTRCSRCGTIADEGVLYCTRCGYRLSAGLKESEKQGVAQSAFSPLFTIFVRPRQTIRAILEGERPQELVWFFFFTSGFFISLSQAAAEHFGQRYSPWEIFVGALLFGGLGNLLWLSLCSLLFAWTGRWIGGQASAAQIRVALAWSSVILIWQGLLLLPKLAIFGTELFIRSPTPEANPVLVLVLFGFTLMELVLAIWCVVVALLCVSEVQGFSVGKAMLNSFLGAIVWIVIMVPVVYVIAWMLR